MRMLLAVLLLAACSLAQAQITPVIPANTVVCNSTASAAAPSTCTAGTNITISGGTIASSGGSGSPGGTSGQIQYNAAGSFGGFTLGGDCTFSEPNITCTKTSGTAFGTFATQNYATPPAIGGTTPAAGAFTTLSASSGTLTAVAGGVTIGSPTGGAEGAGTLNMAGCYVNGVACGTGGSTAFSSITSGTNTTAAMLVGTGASLATTGSGSITASAAPVAGITGLGTGVETFLATPSSANFAAAVTGETGTGAIVFGTSPTLTTPALGTPSALVCTNCSGTAASLNIGGNAATATNLASYPTLCSGGQYSQGLSSGSNNCATPSGGVASAAAGPGIAITGTGSGPYTGAITVSTTAAERTVTSSPTVASTDMGGQIVSNVSGGGTLTIPAISSSVFASGMTLSVVNYSASTMAITTTPTVNAGGGCVSGTGIPAGDTWQILSNGTTLDCFQTVPTASGSGTVTTTGSPASTYLTAFSGTTSITGTANATLSAGALTLGVSGTLGSVKMGNATSGTLTLEPVTGALGAVTMSIPAATDTLADLAGTQTLTNKTISGASNTLSAIALSSLATQSANTVVMNATGSTASPTAVSTLTYLLDEGTTFTVASGTGTCATTSTLTGGTTVGSVKCTGTSGASTVVITLPSATNSIWVCNSFDTTTMADTVKQTAMSATSATLSGTIVANDVIAFACMGS